MNVKLKKINTKSKGALLFELLIVISIIGIISAVAANAIFLSMRSNEVSGDRGVASTLASETLEVVRAIAEEDWQNIYGLTKNTQHYYPIQSNGKWVLTSAGDETVNQNNTIFTRYVIIDNVSRDSSTRAIETSYVSADDDPSTQKVTVTVSWTGGTPVTMSEYFFRWKNKICGQSGWITEGTGDAVANCTDTSYDTKDSAVDITGGTLKLQ